MGQKLLSLLISLIKIDTTVDESQSMEYIYVYLKKLYNKKLFYVKQPLGDKKRFNLIIGNCEQPDILLMGHLDTVPIKVKNQLYPFIDGNTLYGRGSVDMKSGVAINIDIIPYLLENSKKFWMIFYCDEEYNFLGMKKFITTYQGKITPKLTIIPEPTNTTIILGFRGVAEIEIEIGGKSAHTAQRDKGINAINEIVSFVKELECFLQQRDTYGLTSLVNLTGIYGGTDNDGKIIWKGNIIPDIVKGLMEIRLGNDFSQEEFTKYTSDYFEKKGLKQNILKINFWFPPLLQYDLLSYYQTYGNVGISNTFGYSDIQMIKEHIGGDCIQIGPGPNEKSHQEDEYVDIKSIYNAKQIIMNIISGI